MDHFIDKVGKQLQTVVLWHTKARSQNTTGAKRKGKSGKILTGFQKTREGLISITFFIFELN